MKQSLIKLKSGLAVLIVVSRLKMAPRFPVPSVQTFCPVIQSNPILGAAVKNSTDTLKQLTLAKEGVQVRQM